MPDFNLLPNEQYYYIEQYKKIRWRILLIICTILLSHILTDRLMANYLQHLDSEISKADKKLLHIKDSKQFTVLSTDTAHDIDFKQWINNRNKQFNRLLKIGTEQIDAFCFTKIKLISNAIILHGNSKSPSTLTNGLLQANMMKQFSAIHVDSIKTEIIKAGQERLTQFKLTCEFR